MIATPKEVPQSTATLHDCRASSETWCEAGPDTWQRDNEVKTPSVGTRPCWTWCWWWNTQDGPPGVAGIEVCDVQPTPQGGLRVGARFGGFGNDLLKAENLTPRLDQSALRFELSFAEELLETRKPK
jgi:hypothetical protein